MNFVVQVLGLEKNHGISSDRCPRRETVTPLSNENFFDLGESRTQDPRILIELLGQTGVGYGLFG